MLNLNVSQHSFYSSLQEISVACDWLDKLLNTLPISSVKIFQAQLCVQEMLSNIYEYGVPSCKDNLGCETSKNPLCKINLALKLSDNRLIITIVDNSMPYNILEAQIKCVDLSLEAAVPGGNGIRLIKNYADSIFYSNENNKNHTTLEFIL